MAYTGSVEIRNNLRHHTHNGTLPTAGTNLFTALGITNDLYDEMSWFDIVFNSSVEGVLTVVRTFETVSNLSTVNSGEAIPAGSLFAFTIPVVLNETITLKFSGTSGTYHLTVTEKGGIL